MGMSDIDVSAIFLAIFCLAVSAHATDYINEETTISCLVREYNFKVNKPHTLPSGEVLQCWDVVSVNSCWGRCDTSEIPDYEIPYKISNHNVCTFTKKVKRVVRLMRCDPRHPDPYYTVYSAADCRCTKCDPDYTSCESLHG
ncbi:unnamed protein product [Owenia fusiformis]|uniref:Uncharacterized protein n=1 Tax=Owenia fusiformis TaxID=6347 RepID=A0A8J1U3L1_OWEFU|nr:unnamed protein product [Owenia fusiformis]